jgi:hypothetical protein
LNRSRVIRRAFALAAGTAVATAAALAMASPASAHHSSVEGTYLCDEVTGEWVVTWTVGNSQPDLDATLKIVELEPAGTTLSEIVVGATVPAGGRLTDVQLVPADQTFAKLTVAAEWPNGRKDKQPVSGKVKFEGVCEKPTTPPTPTPTATPTATPTPPPGGEGGGDLPVTGAAVGGIVGAAAVLLAIGLGLFLVARRRRVRFTA